MQLLGSRSNCTTRKVVVHLLTFSCAIHFADAFVMRACIGMPDQVEYSHLWMECQRRLEVQRYFCSCALQHSIFHLYAAVGMLWANALHSRSYWVRKHLHARMYREMGLLIPAEPPFLPAVGMTLKIGSSCIAQPQRARSSGPMPASKYCLLMHQHIGKPCTSGVLLFSDSILDHVLQFMSPGPPESASDKPSRHT